MKKILLIISAFLLMFSFSVFAKKASIKVNFGAKSVYSGIGVGFFCAGENVLSIKKFIDKDNALQAGLGWDYGGGYSLSVDYLFNNFDLIQIDPGTCILYWGLGAQVGTGYNDWGFNLGFRIPLGISYVFEGIPLDITLQFVPVIGFAGGEFHPWPTGGLGARYYF